MSTLDPKMILEAWLLIFNTFHYMFTVMFFYTFTTIIVKKFSPYCQLYMAGFITTQVIWNGCPISAFVNLFNSFGNYEYQLNAFFFGVAAEWTQQLRFLALCMAGLLYWSSYETWFKTDTPVDFSNLFKKGDFKMDKKLASNPELKMA